MDHCQLTYRLRNSVNGISIVKQCQWHVNYETVPIISNLLIVDAFNINDNNLR